MNKYTIRRSTLALTIGSALASGATQAATITVDTAQDGPVGGVAGCSLREAIASANNGNSQGDCAAGSPIADTIVFDPSLSHSTITLSEGQIEITSSVTITGPVSDDPAGLVIDGDNLSRVLLIQGPSQIAPVTTTLNQLTLTRGRAIGTDELGGGILAWYANLNLEQTHITNNSLLSSNTDQYVIAQAAGGGVFVSYGSTSLVDSRITGNSVNSYANGEYSSSSAVGAGLATLSGSTLLVNSIISDNEAVAEAGGNASCTASGGMVVSNGTLVVVDSRFSGNSAQAIVSGTNPLCQALAGGLFIGNADSTIVGTTISDNSIIAPDIAGGGGMLALGAEFSVSNSTISGNSVIGATGFGGGIILMDFYDYYSGNHMPASLIMEHSTVAFNTASGIDGIYIAQNVYTGFGMENSLIVQGSAGETACNASVKYVNSLATDVSCTGAATDLADIKLAGLSNNGGPTPTHDLLPGSVAIDAIAECDSEITVDQRGLPRPGTGSSDCDIGAFEVQDDSDLDVIFGDRFEQQVKRQNAIGPPTGSGTSVLPVGQL